MKIALAQIDPTVGDFTGNLEKILAAAQKASLAGARLAVFSELVICGYPPADFLEKPSFLARCQMAVDELVEASRSLPVALLVGVALPAPVGSGKPAINAAVLIDRGQVLLTQTKRLLPFYDVFDEQRYFAAAKSQQVVELDGLRVAVSVCEDAWNDKNFWQKQLYRVDPMAELTEQKPAIHINLSSSPYWHQKRGVRRQMLAAIAKRDGIPVVLVNQVGGNDSLIFDGSSLVLNAAGQLVAQAKSFAEDLLVVDPFTAEPIAEPEDDEHEASYRALVIGTRDYIRKCGFKKALIGLSGGVDSALVAVIAADAIGAENVIAVGMPSPYSSQGSIDDSRRLAENLGIRFELIGISGLFAEYQRALAPQFEGMKADTTEENIQSRIRGSLLMALSNKFAALVLTTGNKSEMAVGYCTLYGDMVGALAVIGDLVKTRVYEVCGWINRAEEIIPEQILTKPPSAELRPDQKDTDSLPPYEVLDPIVEAYVERYETPEQISAERGYPIELVQRYVRLIERNEYKRQQAAPVLKLTAKSFGMGRRFPIAVKVQV